jgi:hypothetical protein
MKNELKQKYYILFKLVDGSTIESDEFPSKSERDIAFNEIMEGFNKHKVLRVVYTFMVWFFLLSGFLLFV